MEKQFTLYDESTGQIQSVTVSSPEDIHVLTEAYFGIKPKDQEFSCDSKQFDVQSYSTLPNDSIIQVTIKKNDAMKEIQDDMRYQADIIHTLIHVRAEINDFSFLVIIDSGASTSFMTEHMTHMLKLAKYTDKNYTGTANGVGTTSITGQIFGCNVKLGQNVFIPINFKVVSSGLHKNMVLIGLDFLNSYGVTLDFRNRILSVNDEQIRFMNDVDIEQHKDPINIVKERIKLTYDTVMNSMTCDQKKQFVDTLNKIVNNIQHHPTEPKYKSINLVNRNIQEFVNSNYLTFMETIGFGHDKSSNRLVFNNNHLLLDYTRELLG